MSVKAFLALTLAKYSMFVTVLLWTLVMLNKY